MRFNNGLVFALTLALLLSSCTHATYFRKVSKNIGDFETVVNRFKHKNFSPLLKSDCIYLETADSLSKKLMEKYELNRICISSRSDNLYDTAITFHRDHNPIFGKADVIYYDFGKSGLRKIAEGGTKTKDKKFKTINSSFIYALYSKPAFGF